MLGFSSAADTLSLSNHIRKSRKLTRQLLIQLVLLIVRPWQNRHIDLRKSDLTAPYLEPPRQRPFQLRDNRQPDQRRHRALRDRRLEKELHKTLRIVNLDIFQRNNLEGFQTQSVFGILEILDYRKD